MPESYQTKIGERGVGLSGCQRQRWAIAQALLKRPTVLTFDEAVASLDDASAAHIAATVDDLAGKETVLFITHKVPRSSLICCEYLVASGNVLYGEPLYSRTSNMPAEKSVSMSFRVSPKFKSLLQTAAARENRSLTNMLETLLYAHCDRHGLAEESPTKAVKSTGGKR